ncbi:MAG: endonuclease/exonuclease/phosphatase family protein [Nitrospira sp.]|jgi:endonuclease/exonuclease/phosphatase family metal-dependent hydrolase|nr:endonuclease/exonuclease/phosphatase family protein [Nitrospira sp.]
MRSRYKTALLGGCMLMVTACAPITPPLYRDGPRAGPPGTGPETFKVLTYNAWHGLDTGEFWVTASQTPEQSEARLQFQVVQIAATQPDIVLLQEINPLPARAERYVQALADRGLQYDEVHQVDACGIRLRGETALIPGLNNGLAILARRTLQLRKLTGLKLSGDLGRCDSASGVQLEELRYAVIGDVTIPETGQHYLVTSTHLHSGIEAGAPFLVTLKRAHQAGYLPRYPEFRWEVEQDRLRRIGELDRLTRTLRVFRRQGAYVGFAVGGDFNFESDFPEYEEAVLLRLEDAHTLARRDRELYTADPERNAWIQIGEESTFPAPLQRLFKELPPDLAAKAREVYGSEIRRPRRIDYLWMESFFPDYCVRQELFGAETNAEGFPASDHYGVLTTFSRTDGSCPGVRPTTR